MAAARKGDAKVGNSLDRFLIRAIIALASLMVGVVLGFSLAVFYPAKPVGGTQQADAEPQTEAKPPAVIAENDATPSPTSPAVAEPPDEGSEGGDDETEGEGEDGDGEPEPEPEPDVESARISGNLIVEVREVTGDARSKADIRAVAKRGGPELEACIRTHGPELTQVRVHHQLYVASNGEVMGSLLLRGVNPELDACVGQAVASWNFGAADQSSFFKLKLVWTI
jgi:hypothetical protein